MQGVHIAGKTMDKLMNQNAFVIAKDESGVMKNYLIPAICKAIKENYTIVVTDFGNNVREEIETVCTVNEFVVHEIDPSTFLTNPIKISKTEKAVYLIKVGEYGNSKKDRTASMVIDLCLTNMMSEQNDEDGVMVFLNEFEKLSRLTSLEKALRIGRSKNIGIVIITSDEEAIYKTYGKDWMKNIKNQCATQLSLPATEERPIAMDPFHKEVLDVFETKCKMQTTDQLSDEDLLKLYKEICDEIVNRGDLQDKYYYGVKYIVEGSDTITELSDKAFKTALHNLEKEIETKEKRK